jgi:hypothetical protein
VPQKAAAGDKSKGQDSLCGIAGIVDLCAPAGAIVSRQLLSPESLRRTGYFDLEAVKDSREAFRRLRAGSYQRTCLEMGLAGVVSTQLWHHTFIDPSLADLPGLVPTGQPALAGSL